ncbi:MAG: CHAT domain-containing protein [Magnetococcales bacterium]|nr:CHAT domain-containing protein [Magnetococcales bacterium]
MMPRPETAVVRLDLTIVRGQASGFLVTLTRDGVSLPGHRVAVSSYRALHLLVDGVRQLLKVGEEHSPVVGRAGAEPSLLLHSVGVELFHLWLAPFWEALAPLVSSAQPVCLTLLADVPDLLNLPWELLQWPDGTLLGVDARFILRRSPLAVRHPAERAQERLQPAPLRILWVSSRPVQHAMGSREAERAKLLSLHADAERCVTFLASPTRAALRQAVQEQRPHGVVLSGPTLISGTQGFFVFEEEDGSGDPCSATEMATTLFVDSGVVMVVVIGRERQHPPPVAAAAAVCQGLLLGGVALALASPTLLTDPFSGVFFHLFLHNLRGGTTVDQAAGRARCAIRPDCEQMGYPAWLLPVLYGHCSRTLLFTICSTEAFMPSIFTDVSLQPVAGLTGGCMPPRDSVQGAIQRLLPDLQSGMVQVLLLRGAAGSGKTQWMTGLAQLLRQQGREMVALAATPFQPLSSGRLLAAFAALFAQHHLPDEAEKLVNPLIGVEERLGVVLAVMQSKLAVVLVLDGLEHSLNPDTGHFLEPAMGFFWGQLLRHAAGGSRVLGGSRQQPEVSVVAHPCYRQELLLANPDAALLADPAAAIQALDAPTMAQVTAMGIFHHPMPVAAYCAVTHNSGARQETLLRHLVDVGLAWSFTPPAAEPLWCLHPLLRNGLERGKQPDWRGNQHVLAGEYLQEQADKQRHGALGLGWLELSLEAVGHYLQAGAGRRHELFGRLLQCTAPLSEYFSRRGFLWEQERLNRSLLAIREHPRPLYLVAIVLLRRNEPEEARGLLERVLSFGEALFPRESALALFELASLLAEQQWEEAQAKLLRALAINQRVEDCSGQAVCHAHLGFLGLQNADMEMARTHLEAALTLCRRLNDPSGIVNLLPWTGELLWRVGNVVAARRHFQEALQLLGTAGNADLEAQLYHRLAIMDLGEEAFEQALSGFLHSLAIKRARGNLKGEAATFFQLGRLAKARGNELASLRFLGLCQRIVQELADPDAGQMLVLFYDLAVAALGMQRAEAHRLLDDVWASYCQDRGHALITKVFFSE